MAASWNPDRRFRRPIASRRGMGALVAFVVWVVAVALIYALIQSQAQRGAFTGVVRVAGLRTLLFAGQSALIEASHRIRNPASSDPDVLDTIEGGGDTGIACEPEVTRQKYAKLVDGPSLTIGPVMYDVVSRPATKLSAEPWLIDLSVRVSFDNVGVKLSRQVRRRCVGQQYLVKETLGPRKGQTVLSSLTLHGDPLIEVVDR